MRKATATLANVRRERFSSFPFHHFATPHFRAMPFESFHDPAMTELDEEYKLASNLENMLLYIASLCWRIWNSSSSCFLFSWFSSLGLFSDPYLYVYKRIGGRSRVPFWSEVDGLGGTDIEQLNLEMNQAIWYVFYISIFHFGKEDQSVWHLVFDPTFGIDVKYLGAEKCWMLKNMAISGRSF